MVKRTTLNELLVILSHYSPIILTILIIILFIKHDRKTILYLSILLMLSFLFDKSEKHHVILVVSFYLFNTLQVWLDVVLDFISDSIVYTIPLIQ